jgi:hypothetical protein
MCKIPSSFRSRHRPPGSAAGIDSAMPSKLRSRHRQRDALQAPPPASTERCSPPPAPAVWRSLHHSITPSLHHSLRPTPAPRGAGSGRPGRCSSCA